MRHLLPPAIAVFVVLAAAPAAGAATVERRCVVGTSGSECNPEPLVVTAAPGETNTMAFGVEDTTLFVRDSGTPPVPGTGCTRDDAQTVRCDIAPGTSVGTGNSVRPFRVEIFAGDGNDRIDASGITALVEELRVEGGDGDDVLTAAALAPPDVFLLRISVLDGGAGRDELIGSERADVLFGGPDGDDVKGGAGDDTLDGDGSENGPFGDDVLDGGTGRDTLDYSSRRAAIAVNLATGQGGQAGESDRVLGVENVRGGKGRNVLTGDGRANRLVNASAGSACGGGTDAIRPKFLRGFPLVPADCERVQIGSDFDAAQPSVLRRKRGIRLRLYPLTSIEARIDVRLGRRVVARRSVDILGAPRRRTVRLPLTRAGRRASFSAGTLRVRFRRPGRAPVGFRVALGD